MLVGSVQVFRASRWEGLFKKPSWR